MNKRIRWAALGAAAGMAALAAPLTPAEDIDVLTRGDTGMLAAWSGFGGPDGARAATGRVRMRRSSEIPFARTSIGFELLDRKIFDPEKTYDLLAESGVKHARCQTGWSRCEPQKGVYEFAWLDDVISNLVARGIQPWFNVGFGNTNYMDGCYSPAAVGNVPLYYGEACRDAWLRFVGTLAKRYKDKVAYWEIWNEPDIANFWQPKKPNADEYQRLIRLTGDAIRREIPDAKIGGCLSGVYLLPKAGKQYTDAFLAAGGARGIDFWCVHTYGRTAEWRDGEGATPPLERLPEYAALREAFDTAGGTSVELWQGEAGYPSWVPKNHWLFGKKNLPGITSQANQAKWILRRFATDFRAHLARSSIFQAVDIVRGYKMSHTTQRWPARHGLIDGFTYTRKAAWWAMGHWNAVMAGTECDDAAKVDVASGCAEKDALPQPVGCVFRGPDGARILYYLPVEFDAQFPGAMTARVTVSAADAPKEAVVVDLLRGGVYDVAGRVVKDGRVTFTDLPITDYPVVLAERSRLPLQSEALTVTPVTNALNASVQPARIPQGAGDFHVERPRPHAGPVVRAADFGFSETNDQNVTALGRALAHCRSTGASRLELAPGTYRCFEPDRGLVLADLTDFTLDGKDALLVFRRPPRQMTSNADRNPEDASLLVTNCIRSVVRGLKLDWDWETDPLCDVGVCTGKSVDETAPDASWFDLELDVPGGRHPWFGRPMPIQTMTPVDAECRRLTFAPPDRLLFGLCEGHFGTKMAWLGPRTVRIWPGVKQDGQYASPNYEHYYGEKINRDTVRRIPVGIRYRVFHRYYGKNGITVHSNRHLTMEDVTVWGCAGMGIVVDGAQAYTEFRRVHVEPKPGARRPCSCTSDGIHIARSKGHTKFIGCRVSFQNDDACNFHDCFTLAVPEDGFRLKIVNLRGAAYFGAAVGDELELRRPNFGAIGWRGRVRSIQGDTLVMDRPAPPLADGDAYDLLFNESYRSDHLLLRDCTFSDTHSRAIIQPSHVTVEGCTFLRTGGHIGFASAHSRGLWCEGRGAHDVVVRNCRFIHENVQADWQPKRQVSVFETYVRFPAPPPYDPKREFTMTPPTGFDVGFHSDILVENCRIVDPAGHLFAVRTGRNVIFRNNEIIYTGARATRDGSGSFLLERAEDVFVTGNRYQVTPGVRIDPAVTARRGTVAGVVVSGNTVQTAASLPFSENR